MHVGFFYDDKTLVYLPTTIKFPFLWISSSYVCATHFELTNPVVQNICDKKHFRGHNVLHLLSFLDHSTG